MRVYKAPELPKGPLNNTVFLAGSIEMGAAEKWQDEFLSKAKAEFSDDWVFLNPRRDDWDASWVQSIANPQFFQQVDWEMTWLDQAHHKVFYFAKDTMSPITLLELGKHGNSYHSHVILKEGYLRAGNVEIFCYKHGIPIYDSIDDVIKQLKKEES